MRRLVVLTYILWSCQKMAEAKLILAGWISSENHFRRTNSNTKEVISIDAVSMVS